jgi:hypothetical protein
MVDTVTLSLKVQIISALLVFFLNVHHVQDSRVSHR